MKRVAVQGIKGAFHEDAARKYFNEEIDVVECSSFRQVVSSVADESVDFAVMAIENSIAGSLLGNYTLLREYHLRVVGEVYLHIQMNLMVLPGVDASKITEIHSHPIALKQCDDFISAKYGEIRRIEKSDTAGAAKELSESKRDDVATIGSVRTSELYGLDIVERGVETNKKNYTRFLILSKRGNRVEDTNKASFCFECGHYKGALADVLTVFAMNDISLTKIQSIPILGKPYEYSFHVDVVYESISKYEKAIHQVLKKVSSLSILGEYMKGSMEW